MKYAEVTFSYHTPEQKDTLIALLSDSHFDGFDESGNELKAYVPEDKFEEQPIAALAAKLGLTYSLSILPDINWNSAWESHFEPVTVDDFCTVRAAFHPPDPRTQQDIVITPKMSFGTGHHATTFMMIRQMRGIDFHEKHVLDYGTGTGVLAILAEKLGAADVVAADNDEWSINNATENLANNHCEKVRLLMTDTADIDGRFNVILANITRNVITGNFPFFISRLSHNGILLLSGLLEEDEDAIAHLAFKHDLTLEEKMSEKGWISLRYFKLT